MYRITKWLLPALVALPSLGCSDSVAPTWSEGAEATVELHENDIVVEWPDATDDTAVTAYRVTVDGEVSVETDASARNWKASALPTGQAHQIEVIALDASGNASAPLKVNWEGRDVEPPTWPVGSLVQVNESAPTAEGETRADTDLRKLRLSWPEATDNEGVEFYRVVKVPSTKDTDIVRPAIVGIVQEGEENTIEADGLPSTQFQVYAVDASENSSKAISGALENPTRLNPLRDVKLDIRKDGAGDDTPKVDTSASK